MVTSFEYRLHSLGPTVLAGLLAWPMAQAGEVLRFFRDFVADAPDELGIMANLRLAPPLPAFPEELHGQPIVAVIVCYAGPVDEGQDVLRPLREFKAPALDTVGPKPYVAHQAMFDAAYPHGRHYYWKAWKLPPLTDAIIDVMVEQASSITSPLSAIPIFTLGGAVGRVDDDATAFTGRSAAHDINFVASWLPDDPEPERHKAWAPHRVGVDAPLRRRRLHQLPVRRTGAACSGRLRRTQVRSIGRAQEQIRPVERLPLQPERPASRLRTPDLAHVWGPPSPSRSARTLRELADLRCCAPNPFPIRNGTIFSQPWKRRGRGIAEHLRPGRYALIARSTSTSTPCADPAR